MLEGDVNQSTLPFCVVQDPNKLGTLVSYGPYPEKQSPNNLIILLNVSHTLPLFLRILFSSENLVV